MLRSLIALALLAGAAWLVRPRRRAGRGDLCGWRWLALGVGIQVLWVRGVSAQAPGPGTLHWLPSLAVLPALRFVWLNRRYRGLWLLAVGALLNLLVMASNGGLMPIAPATLQALGAGQQAIAYRPLALSKDQILPNGAALLAPLGDRLIYRVAGLRIAGSAGDLLVGLGCLLTLAEELCRGSSDMQAPRRRSARLGSGPAPRPQPSPVQPAPSSRM